MSEKPHEGLFVVELAKLLGALVRAGVPATAFRVFVGSIVFSGSVNA